MLNWTDCFLSLIQQVEMDKLLKSWQLKILQSLSEMQTVRSSNSLYNILNFFTFKNTLYGWIIVYLKLLCLGADNISLFNLICILLLPSHYQKNTGDPEALEAKFHTASTVFADHLL